MGRQYLASVLISMGGKPAASPDDVELKPMTPGAWAAWARDWDEPRAGAVVAPVRDGEQPVVTPVLRTSAAEA